MANEDSADVGAIVPPEIRDDKNGVVAKAAGRLSVGRAKQNRLVVIRFDDHGTVYLMSPATARKLARELKSEADALSQ